MVYMLTFTINIPPMLAYIPYMDPMGYDILCIKLSAGLIPCSAPNRSAPAAGLAASRPLRGWPDMESGSQTFHGKTGKPLEKHRKIWGRTL